jgi:hypothetical protein
VAADLEGIVQQLAERGADDALVTLIESAIEYVRGAGVAHELETLLQALSGRDNGSKFTLQISNSTTGAVGAGDGAHAVGTVRIEDLGAEEQRRMEEHRAQEKAAREAAARVAEVENARLEAERRARLNAMAAQQEHERRLAALARERGVGRALVASLARRASLAFRGPSPSISDQMEGESDSGRPRAAAYRPTWILPLRQSSIYVYVFLPKAREQVRSEAHAALDAGANLARESHAIPLRNAVVVGELLTVRVQLAGFEIGEPAPEPWQPPYVRFVVRIRAPADVAPGIHRPLVAIHGGRSAEQLLATFDFDLDVRAANPQTVLRRAVLSGGGAALALAVGTAIQQHTISPIVGLPLSAALVAGGASAWMMTGPQMVSAGVRDQYVVNITGTTVGALAIGEHAHAEGAAGPPTAPAGSRDPGSKDDGS